MRVQPLVRKVHSPGRKTAKRASPASLGAKRSQRSRSPANLKHAVPRHSCSPASLKSISSRRGVSPARGPRDLPRGPRDRSPGWCPRTVTPPQKPRQRAQRYIVGQKPQKRKEHEQERKQREYAIGPEAKRTSGQATEERDEPSDWDDLPVPSRIHAPARTARRDRLNQETEIEPSTVFDSIVQLRNTPMLQDQQAPSTSPQQQVFLRWKKYSPSQSFQTMYKAILWVLCAIGCSILVAGPLSQRASIAA